MKIAARPLKGEAFDVEVDPEETVDALKKKIAELKPEFPAELQKLIFAGKILVDGTAVKEYGIKESDFVVVMVAKAKPPAGAAPAPAAAASAPSEPTPMAVDQGAAAPAPAPADGSVPVNYEAAASTLVTGGAMEGTVTQLCDMGFPREQVEQCLRAAFNNPDRAVEYLMSGIPAGLMQAEQPPPGEAPAGGAPPAATSPPAGAPAGGATAFPQMGGGTPFPAMPTGGGGGGGGGEGGGGSDALAELRAHPQFEQLRAVVQRNPQALNQVLQSLAATHPQLLQQITQNQEEFVRMLQEPAGGGGQDPVAAMLAAAQAAQGGGGMPQGLPPGAVQIELNEAERASIERMMGLGFDRQACLEAFLACDRNEEVAANYLFEHGFEGDD